MIFNLLPNPVVSEKISSSIDLTNRVFNKVNFTLTHLRREDPAEARFSPEPSKERCYQLL